MVRKGIIKSVHFSVNMKLIINFTILQKIIMVKQKELPLRQLLGNSFDQLILFSVFPCGSSLVAYNISTGAHEACCDENDTGDH